MCLLLTLSAAILVTVLLWMRRAGRQHRLGALCLTYWGASLMWTVDGFFRLAEGAPFLDISGNDAWLGLTIVLAGLIGWGILLLYQGLKRTDKPAPSQN